MKTTAVLCREALLFNWHSEHCHSSATPVPTAFAGQGKVFESDTVSGCMGHELGLEFSASFGVHLFDSTQSAKSVQPFSHYLKQHISLENIFYRLDRWAFTSILIFNY